MPWSRKTGKVLLANKHTTPVSDLSVDWYVAVAQREARGGSGGYRRSWEMNGVLVESIKNCIGGSAVAHVHDAER